MEPNDEVLDEEPNEEYFTQFTPWFNTNQKTPEEIQQAYPRYDEIQAGFVKLETLNYEEFSTFKELYYNFQNYYKNNSGIRSMYLPQGLWPETTQRLNEREKELLIERDSCAKTYYNQIEKFTDEEEVNGYKLFNVDLNIISYDKLQKLWEEWHGPDITEEEFREWFDENACSDWSKQDRHGECFGGFYRYPEGSYEKENAYQLSGEDNLNGLCELPYPRCIMKQTIEWGCSNRMESVRYTNFMCHWIKCKAIVVFARKVPSLTELAGEQIPPKDIDKIPPHLIQLVQPDQPEKNHN